MADIIYQELKELVANNAHTQAYIDGCEYLIDMFGADLAFARGQLAGIAHRQAISGSLNFTEIERRFKYYTEMLEEAKRVLSESEFKKFYACF